MTESASRFARPLTRHELVLRRLQVQHVSRVAPELIRVTVGGAELAGFVSDGAADHIKLFFPDPRTGVITTPKDGNPAAVIARDFTPLPRETDAGPVVDLDFYTHENPGPAASWALSATVGDEIVMGGPRGSHGLPADAEAFVLVADETAMPAAARWVADIPSGVPVTVIASITGDGAWVADYLGGSPRVRIVPNAAPAVIAELGTVDASTFVWVAGNAVTLVPIRRHLRWELGLPAEQVAVNGYWRSGVVAWDHHAPLDPTDPD